MLVVGLASLARSNELQPADFSRGAVHEFVQMLRTAPAGARGVVLDVGANDGIWARSWERQREEFAQQHKTIDLHLFEPQRFFRDRLNATAHNLGATFVPAAAWKTDGQLSLRVSKQGSTAASLAETHDGDDTASMVQAVDLAAYILRVVSLPDESAVTLMKLDVEGERRPSEAVYVRLCVAPHVVVVSEAKPTTRLFSPLSSLRCRVRAAALAACTRGAVQASAPHHRVASESATSSQALLRPGDPYEPLDAAARRLPNVTMPLLPNSSLPEPRRKL